MRPRLLASLLLCAAVLPSAAVTARVPVTVTRFHLAQPAPPGDVAIVPAQPGDVQSLEFQSYLAPVAAELGRLGYHVVNDPASPLIATVQVDRVMHEGPPRSSGFSIGLGGGFGGGGYRSGGGVGGGVSLPLGHSRPTEIMDTQLSVQIRDRAAGTSWWEGRASTQTRTDSKDASTESARLASGLFKDFPGESGRTITVR